MSTINKAPFEQLRAWFTEKTSPLASQCVGRLIGMHPYRRAIASLNSIGLRSNWFPSTGIIESHPEHWNSIFLWMHLLRGSGKESIKAKDSFFRIPVSFVKTDLGWEWDPWKTKCVHGKIGNAGRHWGATLISEKLFKLWFFKFKLQFLSWEVYCTFSFWNLRCPSYCSI